MAWKIKAKYYEACNCELGCPCNMSGFPSHGKCEGGWTWHVEHGSFAGAPLDGLNFSVYVNWPAAIHEGNGEALILIDEKANAEQRSAIERLISGQVGGPWGILAWTWPTIHGPYSTPYHVTFDGIHTQVSCGEYLDVECGPIRNPVSGAEAHPGVVLPEGIIFKQGDLGTTTRFRVANGIEYDHSGKYMAAGPFNYSWP